MQFGRFISVFSVLIIWSVIIGCGGKVDSILLGTSLQNAQSAISDAQRLQAEVYAKEGIVRATKLLEDARGAQRVGDGTQSLDLAFQAQVEAKISEIQARQRIAQAQIDRTKEGIRQAIIREMNYKVQTAQTRQAIAEELTHRALDRANRAEQQAIAAQAGADAAKGAAQKSMWRHETQLVISEAQQRLSLAKEAGAMAHAPGDYQAAENLINEAVSLIRREEFDDATDLAIQSKEWAKGARIASISAANEAQATKTEAYTEAKVSIAAAQMELDRAESVYASVHAEDLFQRTTAALGQANVALKTEEYDQALRLAGQAKGIARQAYSAAEVINRQRRAQEVLEEQIAQAKDAIFKAEESIEQERRTNIPTLAPESYKRARVLLADARQALTDKNHEVAITSAKRSLRVLSEAMENAKQVEVVERRIIDAVRAISLAEVDQSEKGIIIRFSGNLFNSGSAKLDTEFLPHLKQLAGVIKDFANYDVRIEGHSDSSGGAEANLTLTEKRVNAFKRYLVEKCGAPEERLAAVGLGESAPIAAEINRSGRAKNRRIDTIILTRQ